MSHEAQKQTQTPFQSYLFQESYFLFIFLPKGSKGNCLWLPGGIDMFSQYTVIDALISPLQL